MKNTIKTITLIVIIATSTFSTFAQEDVVIGKYKTLDSEILGGEVTYLEHLPSGYEKSSSSYPVLVMMNANYLSNFANAVSTIDRLSNDRIPQMIIIGISNTGVADNYWACPEDSGKMEAADKYIDFLESELLPYINKSYRTVDYNIFLGQSNAGLFALYNMLTNVDLFNAYIIPSPMFGWCHDFYFDKTSSFFQSQTAIDKKLYISYGDLDYIQVTDHIDDFKKIIEEKSPKGFKWKIDLIQNEGHVSYNTLNNALLFFFAECTVTEEMRKNSLEDLKKHFTKLTSEYGFKVYPAEEVLFDMGFKRMREKKYDESIEIFRYLINIYPDSARSCFFMGEAYRGKGDLESARKSYHEALEIDAGYQIAINRLKEYE